MHQPQKFLLSLLKSADRRRVAGKKRIHKTIHLMKYAGVEIDAEFRILRYGPYSYEVADEIDELVMCGQATEKEEPLYDFFLSTFTLSHKSPADIADLKEREKKLFEAINEQPIVILEVASTIAFYEGKTGDREEAIKKTQHLKPAKSRPSVLSEAGKLLEKLKST